ncbi:Uu.00g117270.m01.CDS01 [Anthostomella pinea]|uniref:Uu.00g117270.m01.CDS01 n=1 Tax=Anthostomella pinea TaxID=933095 RepID=A0AAI8YEH7_9PEZI|nr:Uu.00g117270.m01.CDS01 [Anthostomella pinea]
MEIISSIILQAVLLFLALSVTLLRTYVRFRIERRGLTVSDYCTWAGWLCTLGWFICSTIALNLAFTYPLTEDGATESVAYLKTVFIGCYFFDIGLFWAKASIVTFYWWLVPGGFKRLRIALYVVSAFVTAAFLATLLTDTLICSPISDNWSLENQMDSLWNNFNSLIINWTLNISADLLLFGLPFFILNCLMLRRRQKIGLAGIFSLGAITMIMSAARFIAYCTDYDLDDASGNALCTAEMCTGIIVVSLPGLKNLIVGANSPMNTAKTRNTNGYVQTGSIGHASGSRKLADRSYPTDHKTDDEMELVSYIGKSSPTTTTSTAADADTAAYPYSGVAVTTDVSVTRSAFTV